MVNMGDTASLLKELDTMLSEARNEKSMNLDQLTTAELLSLINEEDQKVAPAVAKVLPQVAAAVDKIAYALANNGRLIYLGAGTSGRLGILDAVECPPTYSVNHNMILGIIAGGEKAICHAVEGAEDSEELAVADLKAVKFSQDDVLVGIAASGRTPYVIGGLNYAKQCGSVTIALSCNANSKIGAIADIDIAPLVGAEVLTGSTRMKSGTAQKLVLNMLTTAAMIKLGKSYQNLMVDLTASNQKLLARAIRIVMQATDCTQDVASASLTQCKGQVKTAILQVLTGMSPELAEQKIAENQGHLRTTIATHHHATDKS
jgi:N-acetylmuramic acid 6-phosphate etherase